MSRRRILILGGSGFIGGLVADKAALDYEVVVTYNEHPESSSNCKWVGFHLPRDERKLEFLLTETNPDVVINTLGLANIDKCEEMKSLARYLNAEFPQQLAEVCASRRVPIIHFSTDYVFDGRRGNYTEEDSPSPINHYGRTKRNGEQAILREPRNVVLRTSSVYDSSPKCRFVTYILQSLGTGSRVELYSDLRSSPTYGPDVARATFLVMEKNTGGVYHVAGSACVSRYEFGCLLAREFGYDSNAIRAINFRRSSKMALRPSDTCLSNRKAHEYLGMGFVEVAEGMRAAHLKSDQSFLK